MEKAWLRTRYPECQRQATLQSMARFHA